MTPMVKIQVSMPAQELDALREIARRSGTSLSALVRQAVRRVWLRPGSSGPVALWDGEPRRAATDHDTL